MVSLLRSRQQSLALPVSLRFLVPFQARDAESESRFKKDFSECVKLISATAKRVAREAKEVERIEGKAFTLNSKPLTPNLNSKPSHLVQELVMPEMDQVMGDFACLPKRIVTAIVCGQPPSSR